MLNPPQLQHLTRAAKGAFNKTVNYQEYPIDNLPPPQGERWVNNNFVYDITVNFRDHQILIRDTVRRLC